MILAFALHVFKASFVPMPKLGSMERQRKALVEQLCHTLNPGRYSCASDLKGRTFSSSNNFWPLPRGLKSSPYGRNVNKCIWLVHHFLHHLLFIFHRWICPLKAPPGSGYETKISLHMNEVLYFLGTKYEFSVVVYEYYYFIMPDYPDWIV